MMTVKITERLASDPTGKLADAELHFPCTCHPARVSPCTCGPLAGLKLIGFSIWERRKPHLTGGDRHGRNVTFPARSYTVNGERRSFALLRPIADATAHDRLRELILDAYDAHVAEAEQDEADHAHERVLGA